MHITYLSLGSNQGDRKYMLETAIALLSTLCGQVRKKSSIYETAAWGLESQPAFLNMAVEVETTQSPEQLLFCVRNIETQLGRQREIKWGPRTLDIDILFYDNEIIKAADLTVPHPHISERRFVLAPLAEIAGAFIHPELNKNMLELLEVCPDPLLVTKK